MTAKRLFTPGPLGTSPTVKEAMLRDLGSRDSAFIDLVAEVRRRVAELGGEPAHYTAIPVQGSGTFCIEAVLTGTVPASGGVLIAANGAYGRRMADICRSAGIRHRLLEFPEDQVPHAEEVRQALARDRELSLLATVHCETSTGIVNPIEDLGETARDAGVQYFVDAMSSFGAIPIPLRACGIDYLVTSANKCLQGVPGFGWVLARKAALAETGGYARSLSLDLYAQWKGFEHNGQFRFTPPTHALLAFHQALRELEEEGGIAGRGARYAQNHRILIQGMREMGFRTFLPPEQQSTIITSFHYPEYERWSFERFYRALEERGFVIYPGKVSRADCFRIGTIGHLFPRDIHALLAAIREVMQDLR